MRNYYTPFHLNILLFLVSISIAAEEHENEAKLADDVDVQPTKVNRSAHTTGFHGHLKTLVTISLPSAPPGTNECELLLIESLPSGLYVDLDQLADLSNFGGPKVLADKYIDVEKPEFLSPSHKLNVFTTLECREKILTASVSLPFHLRYHQPSYQTDRATIRLDSPVVLVKCSDGSVLRGHGTDTLSPCSSQNDSLCSWVKLVFQNDCPSQLEFSVPVGQYQHKQMVIGGTLSVTILGTLVLICAMIPRDKGKKP